MHQLTVRNRLSGDPGLGLLHDYLPFYGIHITYMQVKVLREHELVMMIRGNWLPTREGEWQSFTAVFPLANWRELYIATNTKGEGEAGQLHENLKRRIFRGLYQVGDRFTLFGKANLI